VGFVLETNPSNGRMANKSPVSTGGRPRNRKELLLQEKLGKLFRNTQDWAERLRLWSHWKASHIRLVAPLSPPLICLLLLLRPVGCSICWPIDLVSIRDLLGTHFLLFSAVQHVTTCARESTSDKDPTWAHPTHREFSWPLEWLGSTFY